MLLCARANLNETVLLTWHRNTRQARGWLLQYIFWVLSLALALTGALSPQFEKDVQDNLTRRKGVQALPGLIIMPPRTDRTLEQKGRIFWKRPLAPNGPPRGEFNARNFEAIQKALRKEISSKGSEIALCLVTCNEEIQKTSGRIRVAFPKPTATQAEFLTDWRRLANVPITLAQFSTNLILYYFRITIKRFLRRDSSRWTAQVRSEVRLL